MDRILSKMIPIQTKDSILAHVAIRISQQKQLDIKPKKNRQEYKRLNGTQSSPGQGGQLKIITCQ
jgi:hypothetical protein